MRQQEQACRWTGDASRRFNHCRSRDVVTKLPSCQNRPAASRPLGSGNTTKVNWSATNVQSCTVSGQTGDTWSGLQSILGGNVSKPITGETTYTLSCIALDGSTLTKSATVKIIPTFQEI